MTRKFLTALFCSLACISLSAQDFVYTDASGFHVYGKAIDNSFPQYGRLPEYLEAELAAVNRSPVWELGGNSAGLYIRFRTDSPDIRARWTVTINRSMNHMTDTGCKGLDLYTLDGGVWRFAGSGRPSRERENDQPLLESTDGTMREYMLYLPLYDGIEKLEIGVREGSVLAQSSVVWPLRKGKVVMYGTSILQGGCASRPGMAFTSIISRRLGVEVVNLGFSGNGRLDYEIARLMAQVEDPAVFVLDEVPNSHEEMVKSNGETFFHILRDAHPDVPVIFVENALYPHMRYNKFFYRVVTDGNRAQKELYEKLRKAGEKRIYYVPADKLIGTDGEGTVDGVHFTDLGMMRYSDILIPVLKKCL